MKVSSKYSGGILISLLTTIIYLALISIILHLPSFSSKLNPNCGIFFGGLLNNIAVSSVAIFIGSVYITGKNYSSAKKQIMLSIIILLVLALTVFELSRGTFYVTSCGL